MTTVAEYLEGELSREKMEALLEGDDLDFAEVVKKHLWDGRIFMRRNASLALRLSGNVSGEHANLLTVAAKDSDGVVRENAVGAIGKADVPAELGLVPLLGALTDPEEAVRITARNALDRVAERADEEALVELLVRHLAHPSGPARTAVSDLLMKFPEVAAGFLLAAVSQASREVSQEAYRGLLRLGNKAVDTLIAALPDPASRPAAATLLTQIRLDEGQFAALGALGESGDPTLVQLVGDLQRQVTVGEKPPPPALIEVEGFYDQVLDGEALEAAAAEDITFASLLRALSDGRVATRANAAALVGLRVKGEDDPQQRGRMAFALAALVRDDDPTVRRIAVAGLQAVGGSMAVGPLLVALSDAHGVVASAARDAVIGLGATRPAELLAGVAPTQPGVCHITVMDALVAAGEPVVDTLIGALGGSPNVIARQIAAASLERLGRAASKATDTLVGALLDPDTEVRRASASALGFVASEDEAVLDALKTAARTGELSVRIAASTSRARLTGTWEPVEEGADPEPIEIDGFEERFLTLEEVAPSANSVELDALVRTLGDGRAHVRHNAALALAAQGDDAASAAPALAIAAKDGEPRVRLAAVTALGKLGEQAASDAVPVLAYALGDPDPRIPAAAAEALETLGEAALEPLVGTLDMYTDLADRTVLPVLASYGEKAVAPLAAALTANSQRVRTNAAIALARLGKPAKGAVDALLARLGDPADDVRAAAAGALGLVDDDSDRVLDALKAARKDGDATVRRTASLALDRLTGALEAPAPPEPIAIDGFEERTLDEGELAEASKIEPERFVIALGDGRPHVRHNAALALGVLGGDAVGAASALAVAVKDGSPAVRAAAATALGKLGAEAKKTSVKALVAALGDPVASVVGAAEAALASLGEAAAAALVATLDDKRAPVGRVAGLLAAQAGPAVDALIALLQHADTTRVGRANAVRALGLLGAEAKKKGVKPVTTALGDADGEVRLAAAEAIERLGDDGKAVLDALQAARKDVDAGVRRAVVHALDVLTGALAVPAELEPIGIDGFEDSFMDAKELGKAAKSAGTERLITALSDGRPEVRHNAAVALGQSGANEAAMPLYVVSKDSDPRVRAAVCTALGELGNESPAYAVPALVARLGDPDPAVIAAARAGLAGLGKSALPAFVKALDRDPTAAAGTVIPILVQKGADIVEPLAQAARNDELSLHIRINALRALGALGPDHAKATEPPLAAALDDPLEPMRAAAKLARNDMLGVGPAPKNKEALVLPEEFTDENVKPDKVEKLGKDIEIEVLHLALQDGRRAVRRNAAYAVAAHGKQASELIDQLLLTMKDTIQEVRRACAESLGNLKLEPEKAGPALVDALKGADEITEKAVLEALAAFGKKIVDPVLRGLNERPENCLPTMIRAARYMPKEFTTPITGYLSAEYNPLIRENAAVLLASMGREAGDAEKSLIDALDETDNLFRMKTILALGRCTTSAKVKELLVRMQDSDDRPEIQTAIQEAMMWMGQP